MALWGMLWWLGATLPLANVYPLWSGQRAVLGSVGLGIALVGVLAPAHPLLLVPLVAVRLATFAASPAGAGRISEIPPPGIEGDFPHVERLQRLVRETRSVLARHVPQLLPGARVGMHHFPLMSRHAFAGDAALHVWYRDSTLSWMSDEEYRHAPDARLAGFLEYESRGEPQIVFLGASAMRAQIAAEQSMASGRWPEALAALARADSLQDEPNAAVFGATTQAERSLCLFVLGRPGEAEGQARRALELWAENPYSRGTLARIFLRGGRYAEAWSVLTAQLQLYPQDEDARAMLEHLRGAAAPAR
jgi:hypothetical protein